MLGYLTIALFVFVGIFWLSIHKPELEVFYEQNEYTKEREYKLRSWEEICFFLFFLVCFAFFWFATIPVAGLLWFIKIKSKQILKDKNENK